MAIPFHPRDRFAGQDTNDEQDYVSSVLNARDCHDPECAVCKFLNGDRSTETLLRVIEVVDHVCAKSEAGVKILTALLTGVSEK